MTSLVISDSDLNDWLMLFSKENEHWNNEEDEHWNNEEDEHWNNEEDSNKFKLSITHILAENIINNVPFNQSKVIEEPKEPKESSSEQIQKSLERLKYFGQ